jgi:hypothetical protein
MRTMASLQHYLATTSSTGAGDALYLHQFTGATLAAPLAGGTLSVEMVTGYPWSGVVEVRVTEAPPRDCGLALRVPAWSARPLLLLNEDRAEASRERGYLVLRRRWRAGDVLRYELGISPRLTYPDRRVDAVRGCAAIERGPLVYCLEQADQPAGAGLEDLALIPGGLREIPATVPGVGETVLIEAGAAAATEASGSPEASGAAVPEASGAGADAITVTAIPYFQWDNRDGGAMRVWIPAGPRVAAVPPSQ